MISSKTQKRVLCDRTGKSVEIHEKTIKIQERASCNMKHVYVFFSLLYLLFCGCISERAVLTDETMKVNHQQELVRAEIHAEEAHTNPVEEEKPEEEITLIEQKPEDEKKETVSIVSIIEELEECYKDSNFEKWKSFLTQRYRERHNDPQYLEDEGWDAVDVESFFYLLVETRKTENINALSISRVEFLNKNKALVYVFLGDEEFPEPQHTFVRIHGKWYKGLREEEGG
jgi:hypothetical protein